MKTVYKHVIQELFLPVDGYTHIVKTLASINGGQTFYYAGESRYFKTEAEALLFLQAQEEPAPAPIQEEEPAELDGTYYVFDCLDGEIGGEPMTAQEISRRLYGEARELTEGELKAIAADYEAELYRYQYKAGERIEAEKLTRLVC